MYLVVDDLVQLTHNVWQMSLTGNFPYTEIQPGQFINIRIGLSCDHLLRRPISIAETDKDQQLLTIVFKVVGAGTRWLSQQLPGSNIDVLGPLGNGFPLPDAKCSALIIGGGVGIPPLYQLAKEIQPICSNLQTILGFRTASDCFWINRFQKHSEVIVTTEDGSLQIQGYVTDALGSELTNWEYVYACGPRPMLKALQARFANLKVKGYVSLEERMACGVGACYGCVCQTHNQLTKRVCKDGPVFNWQEVIL